LEGGGDGRLGGDGRAKSGRMWRGEENERGIMDGRGFEAEIHDTQLISLDSPLSEVIWVSTSRRHQLPALPMLIEGSLVYPVCSVRNDEVFIDADRVSRWLSPCRRSMLCCPASSAAH